MKKLSLIIDCALAAALAFISSSFLLLRENLWLIALYLPAYLCVNLLSGAFTVGVEGTRLRVLHHATRVLMMMLFASASAVIAHLCLLPRYLDTGIMPLVWSAVYAVAVLAVPFVNGIVFLYFTSEQLLVKWRVLGILFGFIFPVNLIILGVMLSISTREVRYESARIRLNRSREGQAICKTKYPILLVHGFFFRDFTFFNYWGRIPRELKKNGATVYYGEHQSARPVPDAAEELARRIRDIVASTGCVKVNVIAHSKGGLDMRWAMDRCGVLPMVASLTTVSTPHRGCIFAERLLDTVPERVQKRVSGAYNKALRLLGDDNPDFISAARDLTASVCTERDGMMPPPESIFTQSVGSRQHRARSGRFPMNLSYRLVKHFDGANDGLVSLDSFEYGQKYILLEPRGKRGISHGDMIDLSRENIEEFDVREFYVQLVNDLKRRGL